MSEQECNSARRVAAALLALETGGRDDLETLIRAGDGACCKLHGYLSQLVGKRGIEAILSRSLAQAREEHPGLQGVWIATGEGICLSGLADKAAGRDPAEVQREIVSILANTVNLLVSLTGPQITLHALRSCWPGVPLTQADL